MSRIGKKPVPVPAGVKVQVSNGAIAVEGPKGKLAWSIPRGIEVRYDEQPKAVVVTRTGDARNMRALHGLARSLIANMVTGVTAGFEKRLEIIGTGYSAEMRGNVLSLKVGYSNAVQMPLPEGVTCEVPDATHVTVRGADKQKVGQFAADVRAVKPPEPYKGKGIRHVGEHVRRKVGKAFASGGAS